MRATGTFAVKIEPLAAEDAADGVVLGRSSIDKTFAGALDGTSKGEMLTVGTPVKGSAAYVAAERVTGTLDGRKGSFALAHRGLMTRGSPDLQIWIVPDSGTGELTGLTGSFAIRIENGQHVYDLDYTLP